MAANAVYWVGADGNIWLKGPNGVQNVGSASGTPSNGLGGSGNYNLSDNGFESNTLSQSVLAKRIADPNPPLASAPSSPNGTGGGAAATVLPDKSNDIALQNAGLGSVDGQTAAGIAAIDKALGGLTGQYDTEAGTNEKSYTTNSDQNQTNFQKNKQSALVNAAQGRRGLFGTLASLGALNGSGVDLANNAVQTGANEDLAGAGNNFATNQSGLDTSIGAFRQADKERRQQASTEADNAKTNVNNEGARSKQGFYSNLANDYAAEGDKENASKYTGLASDLYPSIASTNVPKSNLAYTGAAYTPSSLASYLSGANSTAVTATGAKPGTGGLPGLVATDTRKKVTA